MDRDPISLAARVAALTCVLACAWLPGAARAYVVTYDFAGTGQVCDYVDGGAGTRCADGTAFIGAITLDVDERGPLGADASVRGTREASDPLGWVTPTFAIEWAGRSFEPLRLPGETGFDTYSVVANDYYVEIPYDTNVDELYTRFASARFDAGVNAVNSVIFRRATTDLTWLDGLDFADALLAPGAGAYNVLEFVATRELDAANAGGRDGFYGAVTLTALTRRVAAIPEPSTLLLGCIAVLVVLLARAPAAPRPRRAA